MERPNYIDYDSVYDFVDDAVVYMDDQDAQLEACRRMCQDEDGGVRRIAKAKQAEAENKGLKDDRDRLLKTLVRVVTLCNKQI